MLYWSIIEGFRTLRVDQQVESSRARIGVQWKRRNAGRRAHGRRFQLTITARHQPRRLDSPRQAMWVCRSSFVTRLLSMNRRSVVAIGLPHTEQATGLDFLNNIAITLAGNATPTAVCM